MSGSSNTPVELPVDTSSSMVDCYFSRDSSILFQEDQCSPISSPFLVSDEASLQVLAEQLLSASEQSSSSPSLSPSSDLELDLLLPDFLLTGVDTAALLPLPPTTPTTVSAVTLDQQIVKKEQEEEEEPRSKKATRTRKRQRKDASESTDVSAVTLSRDQLLHFSSQELDNFARNIASVRKLTSSEEKELKRQRRLIKNRESAQASRERKKHYVDELEEQIDGLKSDNSKLLQEVNQLKSENKELREQMQTFHSMFLKKTSGEINDNDSKISFGELLTIRKPTDSIALPQKLKTAGVTLLIILFSFGLFFNNMGLMRSSLPPLLSKIAAEREEVPVVLPSAGIANLWTESKANYHATNRKLMSTESNLESRKPQHISPPQDMIPEARNVVDLSEPALDELRAAKRSDSSPTYSLKQADYQSKQHLYNNSYSSNLESVRKRRFAALGKGTESEGESMSSIFMNEFANESSAVDDSKKSPDLVRWFNSNIQPKPNTAYMACSDAQQIIPENSPAVDPNAPLYVSFLIPSSHAHGNGSDSSAIKGEDSIMMEITCQIVDISITHGFTPVTSSADTLSIPVIA